MWTSPRWLALVGALACGLVLTPAGGAEQVRFRFVLADNSGNMRQVAAGPNGALGLRIRGLGLEAEPYPYFVRPNQLVTFRNPFTGGNVTVPMRLPADTPRLEHRPDRIVYNYG